MPDSLLMCSPFMGYRELLKKYIRHLEIVAGENFIEASTPEPMLNDRDISELRTLSAEINRESYRGQEVDRIENYNYRLRILMNRYALDALEVARMTGSSEDVARRWRTSPRSERYLEMSEEDFARFQRSLEGWLEGWEEHPDEDSA